MKGEVVHLSPRLPVPEGKEDEFVPEPVGQLGRRLLPELEKGVFLAVGDGRADHLPDGKMINCISIAGDPRLPPATAAGTLQLAVVGRSEVRVVPLLHRDCGSRLIGVNAAALSKPPLGRAVHVHRPSRLFHFFPPPSDVPFNAGQASRISRVSTNSIKF